MKNEKNWFWLVLAICMIIGLFIHMTVGWVEANDNATQEDFKPYFVESKNDMIIEVKNWLIMNEEAE